MNAVRVLIVDDVAQVRQDLSTALTLAGGLEIVGAAAGGREALELEAKLEPDAVLMDLEMPDLDGWEAARRIKARRPACRIVALTIHDEARSRAEALLAGIDAFVLKGVPLDELLRALAPGRTNRDLAGGG
jgi:DNA-binding NarL/FixJ family response regulator